MAKNTNTATVTSPNGLFSPYKIGNIQLSHRIVMASLVRCISPNELPNAAAKEFYTQRATPGGLVITEGTKISNLAAGLPRVPGIYKDEHVEAWKPIVDGVHAKGGIIFCQLSHSGRASHSVYRPNGTKPISSTNKPLHEYISAYLPDGSIDILHSEPHALTVDEIPEIVQQYHHSALNAIKAGFDGVEIQSAHGFLIDQFLKDNINDRTDKYGGSLDNRTRFLFEVVDALVSGLGPERVAVRISPIYDFLGAKDSHPLALGTAIVKNLNERQSQWGAKLAYLHVTQPRMGEYFVANSSRDGPEEEEADFINTLQNLYDGTFMCSGGYTRELASQAVERGEVDLVSFGRLFISNPDLIKRFELNAPLNEVCNIKDFFNCDPVVGYTDLPFLKESKSGEAEGTLEINYKN